MTSWTNARPWVHWAGMWLVLLGTWIACDRFWPEAPWVRTSSEPLEPMRPLALKPVFETRGSVTSKHVSLGDANRLEATAFLDSLPDELPPSWRLQGRTSAWYALAGFLNLLPEAQGRRVEVYHWGDSQIEGDRITGVLRESWQRRWGGRGPGWVLPVMPAPTAATVESTTGTVTRQAGFGRGRNLEALRLPFFATNSVRDSARWSVRGNGASSSSLTGWTTTEVWGDMLSGIRATLHNESGTLTDQSLAPNWTRWEHSPAAHKLELRLEATQLQGVFLGSDKGVLVHNLPLRGSSGTLFDNVPAEDWVHLKEHHPPDLVLLQFGGNAVPGIQSPAEARGYARRLSQNISLLRATFPGVPVVVLGPSDMGESEADYPGLAWVVAALQTEVSRAGALYWDLQAVMGGSGSMAEWADRGWAGSDHVHFTRRGAREVGRRFEAALHHEWRAMIRPRLNVDAVAP